MRLHGTRGGEGVSGHMELMGGTELMKNEVNLFLLRTIQARINNIKNKPLVANKHIDKQFRLIFWLYAIILFSYSNHVKLNRLHKYSKVSN